MRRLLLALVTMFSAALLTVTAAPAGADSITTADRSGSSEAERALPPHDVRWATAGETSRYGIFYTRGRVETYKNRVVKLQKSATRTGGYRTVSTDRTTADKGIWSARFRGQVGTHWRVVVPATSWARATPVYLGRIVRD